MMFCRYETMARFMGDPWTSGLVRHELFNNAKRIRHDRYARAELQRQHEKTEEQRQAEVIFAAYEEQEEQPWLG